MARKTRIISMPRFIRRRDSLKFKWCPMCGKRNEDYRTSCKACGTSLIPPKMVASDESHDK